MRTLRFKIHSQREFSIISRYREGIASVSKLLHLCTVDLSKLESFIHREQRDTYVNSPCLIDRSISRLSVIVSSSVRLFARVCSLSTRRRRKNNTPVGKKGFFRNVIFGADSAKWHKGLFKFDQNWPVAYWPTATISRIAVTCNVALRISYSWNVKGLLANISHLYSGSRKYLDTLVMVNFYIYIARIPIKWGILKGSVSLFSEHRNLRLFVS